MNKNAIPVLSLKNVKTGSHTSEKSGRQYMTIPGNIVMLENGQRARLYVSDVYLTDPETGRSMRTQEIRLSLIEEKPVVHTVAPEVTGEFTKRAAKGRKVKGATTPPVATTEPAETDEMAVLVAAFGPEKAQKVMALKKAGIL